jgi:CarboxypepD_reg-like domain/TonB-dependent Receptor Plug Domain
MKTKSICYTIFLIFSINICSSQELLGIIKGKIIEQSTKQPINDAHISVKNTNLNTTSNSDGIFIINEVPKGNYTLEITSDNFQTKTILDVNIINSKTFYLEIELLDNLTNLNEVVIKKFKSENNPATPVSTYSFNREEISRNPGTQGDIFRAIGLLPGVSSSGGQFSAIAVRGQGTKDNVYMVDDMPMFELSHLEGNFGGFTDPNGGRFSIFAPRVIDNAVFQGGGFSGQFGRKSSSYLGLSIKEGNKETTSFSGQFDLLGATLIYDGPISKKTSIFATARYQNFKTLEKMVGIEEVGLPIYADYMIKTTTDINAKNKLSFVAMYNPETFVRDYETALLSKKVENTNLGDFDRSKSMIGINHRMLIGNKSYWKNILYSRTLSVDGEIGEIYPKADNSSEFISKENVPYINDLRIIKNKENEIGYRSIFKTKFNSSSLTFGFDIAGIDINYSRNLKYTDTLYTYSQNDFRPINQKYIILQPQDYNSQFTKNATNTSAYIDYSFLLLKRITLNTSLRYDYTGFTTQNNISPRLSGSINIDGKSSINFSAGTYYQDPLYADIADQPITNKLKSERTNQYVFGYKNQFSNDLKFVIETWYKDFDNLITRPQNGQPILTNDGTGNAYGLDINLTKRLSEKYFGQIGYSYMQSKRNDNNGLGNYDFSFSQPHIFSFLGSYKPNNKWVFSSKFRYSTGRPKDKYIINSNVFNDPNNIKYSQEISQKNADKLNDFISLDARVDYKFYIKKVAITAFIDIVDILNRYNQSSEMFQPITGKTYYDGLAIFPSFGVRIEF